MAKSKYQEHGESKENECLELIENCNHNTTVEISKSVDYCVQCGEKIKS